mgnify:CR=1 FL=1
MRKFLALVCALLLTFVPALQADGQFRTSYWGGGNHTTLSALNALATFAMAGLNSGICLRFVATEAKDIASVKVVWSAVSAPGQVTVRIETIDMTTGKCTGTLYDANAVATAVVPTVDVQTITLGAATTNLTAGTTYGVMILTTTGGTTQTIRYMSDVSGSIYPNAVLTAADGTTRANLAEQAAGLPIMSFVMDDATETTMGNSPYWSRDNSSQINALKAAAVKMVIPANTTFTTSGVDAIFARNGTPAGDLRLRVMDASDNVVANTTVTADLDLMTATANRYTRFMFPASVDLVGGTYRLVWDCASCANDANDWALYGAQITSTGVAPSGFKISTTADRTAVPIVWSDNATGLGPPVRLIVDNVTASAGSTGGTGRVISQ